MSIVIKVENLSKQYQLGLVGTGTLRRDFQRWYSRIRGKEDPTLKIGQENILSSHRLPNIEAKRSEDPDLSGPITDYRISFGLLKT